MDSDTKAKVITYLQNQIARSSARLRAYTIDNMGKKLPKRNAYFPIEKQLNDFCKGANDPRWIAISGLRGTGKTTLLAQLHTELNLNPEHKLYLSLDESARVLGVSFADILSTYEELLGSAFETLKNPIYLFLDEVQYDKNWGIILKTIYDRSSKVFILCTSSSALALQTNADIARRLFFNTLYPLSFTEYMLIKTGKQPEVALGKSIQEALFSSTTASEVYGKLAKLSQKVNGYWMGIDTLEIDRYLKYGTLPFTLKLNQEPLIYTQINQTLSTVLAKDIPQLTTFDKETIDKLSQILYAVASADIVSLNAIATTVGLNPKTVGSVFDALEKTEVLLRVYPYGSHYKQVRKTSKYLFMSSAYRSMYYNLVGSIFTYQHYKGKLLEDVVGLSLTRTFTNTTTGYALTYDSVSEGADFIVTTRTVPRLNIVIEVSLGEKGVIQAKNTLKRVGGKYGLVVSSSPLILDEDNYVTVPIQYFLLI